LIWSEVSLGGLFLWSLLAATLLPLSSEAALAAAQASGAAPAWQLLAVASAGNVLGAVINWVMGRYLLHFQGRRWFPFPAAAIEKAGIRFQRYGGPALLFSWVPVIGDPLTFAAGVLRYPLLPFLLLVAIGKTLRYAIVLGAVESVLP